METGSCNIDSLLMLRENMEREGILTRRQAWALQHSMLEISIKTTDLDNILREEVLPAVRDHDDHRLYKALMAYELKLWEIQEFRYIAMARKVLDRATVKLSDKLYPDED